MTTSGLPSALRSAIASRGKNASSAVGAVTREAPLAVTQQHLDFIAGNGVVAINEKE